MLASGAEFLETCMLVSDRLAAQNIVKAAILKREQFLDRSAAKQNYLKVLDLSVLDLAAEETSLALVLEVTHRQSSPFPSCP